MPRSASRRTSETYRREYLARAERSRALGISYARARSLRGTFKLSDRAKARIVRVYGRAKLTEVHTQYAVTRAHIARAQLGRGENLSKPKARAVRTIAGLPDMRNPVLALGNFYQAIGMDPGSLPTSPAPLPRESIGGGGYEEEGAPDYGRPDYGGPEFGRGEELAPMDMRNIEDFDYFEEDIYDWYDDMVDDFEMYDYGEYTG